MDSETAYLENGQMVMLVQKLDDGRFLVQEMLEVMEYDSWGEPDGHIDFGNLRIVNKIYNNAPIKLYNNEIEEIQKKITELNKTKSDIFNQINVANQKHSELLEKFSRYEQLKNIENFIDGKITHYVLVESHSVPKIVEFKSYTDEYSKHELRLLALFGTSNGTLAWKVNRYKDGSGYWTECIPCLSYDEALSEARKIANQMLVDCENNPHRYGAYIVKEFEHLGIKPSDKLVRYFTDKRKQELEKQIEEDQRRLDEKREEIKKVCL